jgi:type VI secretion system secreted protein VgrG
VRGFPYARRSDFRIWQEMTVHDIVTEVLDKNGIPHEWRLKQPLKNWVYLVQYNETDLAFICRRLEHEGIYFWFEHAAGGETLVLADHFTSHPNCPGNPSIPFYASPDARAQRDHFDTWRLTREVAVNASCLIQESDYAPYKPRCDLLVVNAQALQPVRSLLADRLGIAWPRCSGAG